MWNHNRFFVTCNSPLLQPARRLTFGQATAYKSANEMSRFHSYLSSAASILHSFRGEQPFNIFLKSFFSQHKKYGSKDRKQISHLCYCYFRLGCALLDLPTEERIQAAVFLCETKPIEILSELKPQWIELIALPAEEKSRMLGFSIKEIFPWGNELSEGIDETEFCSSILIQPDLYLRLRPGMENRVKQKLVNADVSYNQINHSCLGFENSVQVDKIVELDREAVVQDYNSQRVGELLDSARSFFPAHSSALRVYDCCAASGGKSILAYDILKNIDLTVSDIRESILVNLRNRFERAGIRNYRAFVQDLTTASKKTSVRKGDVFDLVIVDAPCSGSGTWSRTPEQLYYFKEDKIEYYSSLQKAILENVIPLVKEGGYLLYITCSVFRKENEEVVNYLQKEFNSKVDSMELLRGYDIKADTLFAALLQSNRSHFS